ncbi:MAG TPA: alpha/beta fold hydrolase [Terriglobales bacterium]|nr:alpha/beta fold hydrolase [Terriglobales bacterium]
MSFVIYRFGTFELDVTERRLTENGQLVPLRSKVFDTLVLLVENPGRLLRKEELMQKLWPDRVVEENNLDHNISALRNVLRDDKNSPQFIETVPRQGYRFIAAVSDSAARLLRSSAKHAERLKLEQEIRFFPADDGSQIAYSVIGRGPVLVKAANWLNHLEYELSAELWQHWISLFASHHTYVRYDERGNGLSSWNTQDFSFGAWCNDLQKVTETLSLDKFSLFGISQGAAVAVWYAANFPDRVDKLIIYGGYARGWDMRGTTEHVERRDAMITLIRLGWGKDNPAFRQLFTSLFMPEAKAEHMAWFNDLQRVSTSPENAVRFMHAFGKVDVFDLLPHVKCPTLVIHVDKDAVVPIREGRLLAARIPGAQFVELPGRNHVLIEDEPAWPMFVKEVGNFMGWKKTAEASG